MNISEGLSFAVLVNIQRGDNLQLIHNPDFCDFLHLVVTIGAVPDAFRFTPVTL
jgi:hypothetical protein